MEKMGEFGVATSVFVVGLVITAVVAGVVGYVAMPTPAQPPATRIGEGYDIVLVTGDEADAFTTSIVKGAKDAAKTFGNDLKVLYSKGWATEEFNKNLRMAVGMKPDAIIYESFGTPSVVADLVDKAYAQGTVVTLMNFDIPEISNKYKYTGCVAPDPYEFGYAAGQHAVEEFGLGSGDRAAVIGGFWTTPVFRKRTQGIYDGLENSGATVDKVEIPVESFGDPSLALDTISGYVSAHPGIDVIAFDGAGTTSATTWYMKQMGKKPGEINVFGIDPMPGSLHSIKERYLDFVWDQQQYLYGYQTTLNLILSMKWGFSGLKIDTTGGWADNTNVDMYLAASENHIR